MAHYFFGPEQGTRLTVGRVEGQVYLPKASALMK
jgi:hypothetical protein